MSKGGHQDIWFIWIWFLISCCS